MIPPEDIPKIPQVEYHEKLSMNDMQMENDIGKTKVAENVVHDASMEELAQMFASDYCA